MTANYNGKKWDIIGDVHGCYDELITLLEALGYERVSGQLATHAYQHPDPHRKLVFVGDYADRGPKSDLVLDLVATSIDYGSALGVLGNHDDKLRRYLMGRNVKIAHGLDLTISQMAPHNQEWKDYILEFLDKLSHHLILDRGKLVVAHAGLEEQYFGQNHGKAISMALYGKTTGETDEYGLPVRLHWEEDYTGDAVVVYGHTPISEVAIVNNTYCIDTACVFGGNLTALRYPEMELVSVPALQEYAPPRKPLVDVT